MPEAAIANPTARLAPLVGTWEGPTTTWFSPDEPVDHSRTAGTFRLVAEGLYLMWEYTSTCKGEPSNGSLFIGFDETKNEWAAAWGDSFHASQGLLISKGPPTAPTDDALLDVLTHFGPAEEPWGWRTVIDMPAPDQARIRAFLIMPGGQSQPAVETCLQRQA